jgi:anti-anti-sigma factor
LVIALSGELNSAAATSMGDLIDEQTGRSRVCRVVLDLAHTTGISADGIALLVGLHRRARIEGFALFLIGLINRNVERPLRLAGALPLFTTRTSIGHALAGLPGAR